MNVVSKINDCTGNKFTTSVIFKCVRETDTIKDTRKQQNIIYHLNKFTLTSIFKLKDDLYEYTDGLKFYPSINSVQVWWWVPPPPNQPVQVHPLYFRRWAMEGWKWRIQILPPGPGLPLWYCCQPRLLWSLLWLWFWGTGAEREHPLCWTCPPYSWLWQLLQEWIWPVQWYGCVNGCFMPLGVKIYCYLKGWGGRNIT